MGIISLVRDRHAAARVGTVYNCSTCSKSLENGDSEE
jgi:hypothetical protein